MVWYTGTDLQVRYNGPLAQDSGLKSDLGGYIYNFGRTFIIQKYTWHLYFLGCSCWIVVEDDEMVFEEVDEDMEARIVAGVLVPIEEGRGGDDLPEYAE